jgi:hypothetical protein
MKSEKLNFWEPSPFQACYRTDLPAMNVMDELLSYIVYITYTVLYSD